LRRSAVVQKVDCNSLAHNAATAPLRRPTYVFWIASAAAAPNGLSTIMSNRPSG